MRALAPPVRLGQTSLPDGRLLAWAEWGPETGAPVLLCPGAATTRSLGFAADALDAIGVRLVSLDRPGLGGSTPAPGRTLLDWAEDVRRFADARGLSPLAIVGNSQGAPFALACAARGVARAVALVSGTDELAHPAVRARLDPGVGQLVDQVAADPGAASRFLAAMTPERMWSMVLDGSGASDRAVYTAPEFEDAYRRALGEAFAQGPDGYVQDTLLSMSRWPFDPVAVSARVDLWYGALDGSPVHSPDHGATLAARLPHARRTVLAEGGGALLWTHGPAVLERLLEPPPGA